MTIPSMPGLPPAASVEAGVFDIFTLLMGNAKQKLGLAHLPRGAHPKHHTIVRGEFRVPRPQDNALAHGIFAREFTYPAYVRFSNAGAHAADGSEPDVRGVAIKVMKVDGEKLLDERLTQDFLLVDSPRFMARDPEEFLHFLQMRLLEKQGKVTPEEVDAHFPIFRPAQSFVRSLVPQTYYSQTAYRLGDLKVKYRLHPRGQAAPRPLDGAEAKSLDPDYLKKDLIDTIAARAVEYDFDVQVYTDEMHTPEDDPTREWGTRFVTVASLVIDKHDIRDSDERKRFAEDISFNPWHSLKEHAPIGRMNELRRDIYVKSLAVRRAFREPTGDEALQRPSA